MRERSAALLEDGLRARGDQNYSEIVSDFVQEEVPRTLSAVSESTLGDGTSHGVHDARLFLWAVKRTHRRPRNHQLLHVAQNVFSTIGLFRIQQKDYLFILQKSTKTKSVLEEKTEVS